MVQYLGAVDLRFEHETLRVHQDVALASLDLLAPVVTSIFSAHRGGLNRLGIHHARAGLRAPFKADPQPFAAGPVDPLEGAVDPPGPKIMVDGGPSRKVVGEQ